MARTLRLLIVEDSEDDVLLEMEELRKGGFDPDFVRVDTPQALEAALENTGWDAVIADYNLPSFTGLDTLRIFRANGMDIPCILVSGAIGEEQAVEAMKAGFHDFIIKGHLSRLPQVLERELRESEVRREHREAVEALRRTHAELERRVAERTAELQDANATLRDSRRAALNMMEDAVIARQQAEETSLKLQHEATVRRQAEEALRESEERLRFALETIQTGAWDLDLVTHNAFRSRYHDLIFGYPELQPEWTYEMFLDHVLPEDRATVDGKFRQATENRSDWSFECRIRRVDGEVRWILAAGRHRQDTSDASRRLAGIVQDITERKHAEEEIHRHTEELSSRNEELTRLNRVMEGRELRMIELKKEINELRIRAGQPPLYPLDFENAGKDGE